MTRYEAVSFLESKFLQGYWLSRKDIMVLTEYSADVNQLVRGVRERGIPVVCLSAQPANETKWGILPESLHQHAKNPHSFRMTNLALIDNSHKANAIKKVVRIKKQYGKQLIQNIIKK